MSTRLESLREAYNKAVTDLNASDKKWENYVVERELNNHIKLGAYDYSENVVLYARKKAIEQMIEQEVYAQVRLEVN